VHTDRDKPGQFIGKVDAKSPAEYAGIREGDRIIELNDLNVEKDFHRELSEKIRQAIRSGSGYIKLLVVDAEADRFFSERHAQLSSTQSFVEKLSTPAKRTKSSKCLNQTCCSDRIQQYNSILTSGMALLFKFVVLTVYKLYNNISPSGMALLSKLFILIPTNHVINNYISPFGMAFLSKFAVLTIYKQYRYISPS